MIKRLFLWGFCTLVVLFSSTLYGDSIKKTDGSVIDGIVIESETAKVVRYKYKNVNAIQSIQSDEVETVTFSRPSATLKKGLRFFRSRNYNAAVNSLRKVYRPKYKPYGKFYLGECYKEMGRFNDAIAAYKFLEKVDHRLTPKAKFSLGQVYLLSQKYSEAASTFEAIKKARYNNYWTLKAQFGLAQALLKQGKYSRARSEFSRVQSRARSKYKRLSNLAAEGKGLASLGDNRVRDAQRTFEEILDQGKSSEVFAGAYLGLGKVFAKQGKHEKAALAFLRVVLLYGGYERKRREALRLAIKSFEAAGQNKRAAILRKRFGG